MFYNYKSNKVVQDVIFSYNETLIIDIIDEYKKLHRYEAIGVYAPYHIVKEIVRLNDKWLYTDYDKKFNSEDEVILTISYDGMCFVEKARDKGVLKNSECCLIYVYDSFKKKDVDELSMNNDSILVFGFEEDFNRTDLRFNIES